jgi:hypothetical protein
MFSTRYLLNPPGVISYREKHEEPGTNTQAHPIVCKLSRLVSPAAAQPALAVLGRVYRQFFPANLDGSFRVVAFGRGIDLRVNLGRADTRVT